MNSDPILRMIGLAMRAGKISFGANLTVSAIRSHNKPSLVVVAKDASENTRKKILDSCSYHGVKIVESEYSGDEFAKTIGKTFDVMVVSIMDEGFAKSIINKINDPDIAGSKNSAGGAII